MTFAVEVLWQNTRTSCCLSTTIRSIFRMPVPAGKSSLVKIATVRSDSWTSMKTRFINVSTGGKIFRSEIDADAARVLYRFATARGSQLMAMPARRLDEPQWLHINPTWGSRPAPFPIPSKWCAILTIARVSRSQY